MLYSHEESWIPIDKLGSFYPKYKPTYQFSGKFINKNHKFYSFCPSENGVTINIGIKGWLRRDDALKLYELAYFSKGDILELGSYNGLSTSIIAEGIRDSKTKVNFLSVDIMFSHVIKTYFNLLKRGLSKFVSLRQGSAEDFCKKLKRKNKKFSFIFIDHSHSYEDCIEVCKTMKDIVNAGGFCLFHDFNDPRECDNSSSHGVSKAVLEGLDKKLFKFWGIYGCSALFRRIG